MLTCLLQQIGSLAKWQYSKIYNVCIKINCFNNFISVSFQKSMKRLHNSQLYYPYSNLSLLIKFIIIR